MSHPTRHPASSGPWAGRVVGPQRRLSQSRAATPTRVWTFNTSASCSRNGYLPHSEQERQCAGAANDTGRVCLRSVHVCTTWLRRLSTETARWRDVFQSAKGFGTSPGHSITSSEISLTTQGSSTGSTRYLGPHATTLELVPMSGARSHYPHRLLTFSETCGLIAGFLR